jgi:hypothetical protein
MLTNQEKIEIIINRLNNLELTIQSYIDHAEILKDKYSLEDKLAECNAQKTALLGILEDLGGTWN